MGTEKSPGRARAFLILRTRLRPNTGRVGRLMCLISAATLVGCGGSVGDPPVYPVKGKVIYKGKPVPGGSVVFELEGDGTSASKAGPGSGTLRATGRIETDGSFRLVVFPGTEGVPAGIYKVGITSIPPRSEGNLLDAAKPAGNGNPDVLRGKYSDPKSSGLQARVEMDRPNEPTF